MLRKAEHGFLSGILEYSTANQHQGPVLPVAHKRGSRAAQPLQFPLFVPQIAHPRFGSVSDAAEILQMF